MIDRRLIGEAKHTWTRSLAACAVALAACASGETPGAPADEGTRLGALAQPLSAAEPDAGEPGADAAAGPSNDCCTTSSSGGCNDAAVAAGVCEGDPFCCSPSSVPGCTDAPVAACICEIDPFCCVFRFDQSCVNLGVSRCNASCGGEEVVP